MAKAGEIAYMEKIGDEGREHAYNKPFSDPHCGLYLMDMGTVMSLMPPPPARVLDLGVGSGWTSVFLAKRGYDVVGQDIAEDMILYANKNKSRYQVENVDFISCDFEEMNFDNEFDCALFYDSLHHSVDEERVLTAVYRSLKRGGKCITVEPGEGHSTSPSSIKAIEEYGVTEKDMPPKLIMKIGAKAGFIDFHLYKRHFEAQEILPEKRIFKRAKKLFKETWRGMSGKFYLKATRVSNFVVMTK